LFIFKGKLWTSILNENCGQSVCKKSGKKANWQQCPKAATEESIEEVTKKENEILKEGFEKKIEEVTKMQKVMENQLSKILEKICQDCGEEPVRMTPSGEEPTATTATVLGTEVKQGATKMKVLYTADGSGIIDQVLLKLEGDNALNCIFGIEFGLGGVVTTLENIECTHMTGITDIFSDKDDFAYTLEYENNIEFLMLEQIIHCFGTNSMGKLRCKGYLGQPNTVYVQNSFVNITEQDECQEMCNKTPDCTFWTFSAMKGHHHNPTRVKRNHQGPSECGIRNYYAPRKITIKRPVYDSETGETKYVIDKHQRCGRKNNSTVFVGKVFVQFVIKTPTPAACAKKATLPAPADFPFKSWNFWTFSFADNRCVLANYSPSRSIQVLPIGQGKPVGIISGIAGKDLLAEWDSVTVYPFLG